MVGTTMVWNHHNTALFRNTPDSIVANLSTIILHFTVSYCVILDLRIMEPPWYGTTIILHFLDSIVANLIQ